MKANYAQMDQGQLQRIMQRRQLMQWRFARTKNFARKSNRTLEEALLHISQRFSSLPLADAVDEMVQEMDAIVDKQYHSSNEPAVGKRY